MSNVFRRLRLLCHNRLAAQAALVELLEEAGLPPVCAALAVEDDADKQLGTVLAEAVQVGSRKESGIDRKQRQYMSSTSTTSMLS